MAITTNIIIFVYDVRRLGEFNDNINIIVTAKSCLIKMVITDYTCLFFFIYFIVTIFARIIAVSLTYHSINSVFLGTVIIKNGK